MSLGVRTFVSFFGFVVAVASSLSACSLRGGEQPVSPDTELRQKLVGNWFFGETNSGLSYTTTIRSNGTYSVRGTKVADVDGTFSVSNGFVVCVATNSGNSNRSTPVVSSRVRIARVDQKELVLKYDAGGELIGRRRAP